MAATPLPSRDELNQQEWNSSWNWSASGFYSSRQDTRLWVPKRGIAGSGMALNFGHRSAKLAIATISLPLVGGLVFIVLQLSR